MTDPSHPDPADDAYARLRGHTRADLRFDEHLRPIEYVIAPDGRLVAPVMVAMMTSVDTVLFVPAARDGAMEVMVSLEPFDERTAEGGALADRWRIHHGDPPDVNWATLTLDAARCESYIIDGEALRRPNPLADVEPRLCRWMNDEHAADLVRLGRRFADQEMEHPRMVAIDPTGFDVRGRFVHRIAAIEPMATEEDARRMLVAMMAQAAE